MRQPLKFTKLTLVLDIAGAVSVETTVSIDCLFSETDSIPRSISKTTISLLLPIFVFVLGALYWVRRYRKDPFKLRKRVVLTAVVVFYVTYIGLVTNATSALACERLSDGFSSDLYWLEDTSVRCFRGSHRYLVVFLVSPVILLIVICFPIGSAVYLCKNRKAVKTRKNQDIKERFGFMFEAYSERCLYWDCVILLRKAALALVIVFGASLGGNMQGLISVCVLILALYLQTKYMPFKKEYQSFNVLEILSLSVSLSTFLSGLFLNDERISQSGRVIVSVLALVVISGFVLYSWIDILRKTDKYLKLASKNYKAIRELMF